MSKGREAWEANSRQKFIVAGAERTYWKGVEGSEAGEANAG